MMCAICGTPTRNDEICDACENMIQEDDNYNSSPFGTRDLGDDDNDGWRPC